MIQLPVSVRVKTYRRNEFFCIIIAGFGLILKQKSALWIFFKI